MKHFAKVRFRWDLNQLTPLGSIAPFTLHRAGKKDESVYLKTAQSALSVEPGWNIPLVQEYIREAFDDDPNRCLSVLHGERIVGISVIDPDPNATNHLLTGPCVLSEYRCRGLGTALLWSSLESLREAGLKFAYGVTRERTSAARYVYCKFGGQIEPCESGPETHPRMAA